MTSERFVFAILSRDVKIKIHTITVLKSDSPSLYFRIIKGVKPVNTTSFVVSIATYLDPKRSSSG